MSIFIEWRFFFSLSNFHSNKEARVGSGLVLGWNEAGGFRFQRSGDQNVCPRFTSVHILVLVSFMFYQKF